MSWRSVINSVIDYLLGKKKWESPEAIFGSFSQYGSIRSSLWRIVKFMSPFKSSIFFMYGFSRPSKCGFGYVMWWRGGKSNVKASKRWTKRGLKNRQRFHQKTDWFPSRNLQWISSSSISDFPHLIWLYSMYMRRLFRYIWYLHLGIWILIVQHERWQRVNRSLPQRGFTHRKIHRLWA